MKERLQNPILFALYAVCSYGRVDEGGIEYFFTFRVSEKCGALRFINGDAGGPKFNHPYKLFCYSPSLPLLSGKRLSFPFCHSFHSVQIQSLQNIPEVTLSSHRYFVTADD
jgi:hypothetical protein